MMKILINIFLLLIIHQFALSQVKDTLPVSRDTIAVVTDTLPVLSDTTQYNNTSIVSTPAGKDTLIKKKIHSPRKATIRSAIIPGWGQVYNKKYWKVPIVYAAIGIPGYLFFDNKKWYNKTRFALSIVANERYNNVDSLAAVDPQLKPLVDLKASGSLINYRNQFRRNMDYSILFTLLMWGLNIADATVDAHLRDFNVNEDLSIRIDPAIIPGPGTLTPGISLVVNFK